MTSPETGRAEGATRPSVSIVVPTHNRRAGLPALLDALEPEPAAEIVVVVNAAHDGSLELLEERAQRDARVKPAFLAKPGQIGALRKGVEMASGEVVLLLDDDVIAEPGLVDGHARHHTPDSHRVAIGYMPVALPARRRAGQYPAHIYSRAYELACREYERDPSSILRGLWAGNLSIGREDFLRVDATAARQDGYGYHEDRDFGLRCEAAGLEGIFDRSLLARHLFEKTPQAFLAASRNSGRTRAQVYAAHPGTLGPLPQDFFEQVVPRPGRTLVRLARGNRLRRPVQTMLMGLTTLAGALHAFRLETHLGYVMGVIEQQRGASEAGWPEAVG